MNSYTPQNPPRRGNARKIWKSLSLIPGLELIELHYNPNNFERSYVDGWAIWACALMLDGSYHEFWCGLLTDGRAYLLKCVPPYSVVMIGG